MSYEELIDRIMRNGKRLKTMAIVEIQETVEIRETMKATAAVAVMEVEAARETETAHRMKIIPVRT